VSITATEFKFSPTSIQVPLGQKITFTLSNTGTVDHDVTVQAAGFTLSAKAGQSATSEFTFDKAGVFDFFCSIPGHKEAGMQGRLTVVDPSVAVPVAVAATQNMAAMGAPTTSVPDIKPLPADLKPLLSPQVAPAITRTEPAYVKYDLTTQKVTALMADGVAYEYWTFNGTVPGPMIRVRQGDTVELTLKNSPDSSVAPTARSPATSMRATGASHRISAPNERAAEAMASLIAPVPPRGIPHAPNAPSTSPM